MITVAEADLILSSAVKSLRPVSISLKDAVGFALASPLKARLEMPPFDQAAVDGFAIMINDLPDLNEVSLKVAGEIKAGDAPVIPAKKDIAYRIFTGAPVPKGTFAVVMQERVHYNGETVTIPSSILKDGANIRRKARQMKKGTLLFPTGQPLNPAAIGLLAAQGYTELRVFPKPVVGLIVTGNELVPPGLRLGPGKIHESNSFSLRAALSESGYGLSKSVMCADKSVLLDRSLGTMLDSSDVILLTGGISVGKYDLVHDALKRAGVRELFYKVAQKPGKPFFAGRKGRKIVFALPGNPAAVLVCFYRYVLPALQRLSGIVPADTGLTLPLAESYEYNSDRALFLRAVAGNGKVSILAAQDSDNLFGFAQANALVYLTEGSAVIKKGQPVSVIPLTKH